MATPDLPSEIPHKPPSPPVTGRTLVDGVYDLKENRWGVVIVVVVAIGLAFLFWKRGGKVGGLVEIPGEPISQSELAPAEDEPLIEVLLLPTSPPVPEPVKEPASVRLRVSGTSPRNYTATDNGVLTITSAPDTKARQFVFVDRNGKKIERSERTTYRQNGGEIVVKKGDRVQIAWTPRDGKPPNVIFTPEPSPKP